MRAAYASGLDVMLWVCAAIALAAALLALLFLPRQTAPADAAGTAGHVEGAESGREAGIPRRPGQNDLMDDVARAGRPAGLRERKKARTRAAIREHALRLFREQGYAATTVEQIAAAADVSPATFFRYFPTKEDVVLQDDFDILTTLESLNAQPRDLSPIAAMPGAAASAYAAMTEQDLERFWPRRRG